LLEAEGRRQKKVGRRRKDGDRRQMTAEGGGNKKSVRRLLKVAEDKIQAPREGRRRQEVKCGKTQ
jgi:hypothetical protein